MADFEIRVLGAHSATVARVALDCETLAEAKDLAANLISPHGHQLLADGRFAGQFEPGWGDHLDEDSLEDA
ncbi:hypothetical protein [Phenylobacterium sp.]|uniref:hypothetical protein n=1 Tax=Phenylobacterium sp. TaxID=1871053 RepID=UPI002F928821